MKKWVLLIHSLLVLEAGSSGVAKRCDYKKCADRHLSTRKRKSCNSYEHYASCMAKYEMICRGDMAYHSNIKVVNLKLNLMKCDKKSHDKESRDRSSNGKKSRSRDSKSRRKSSSHNRDELDYADPTNSAGSSSSSSAAFPDIISKGMATSLDSKKYSIPRIQRPVRDYQADDPNRSNVCTFESEISQSERSLCAVIGSANSFRIKNWLGMPHTSCPVTDGAHQIFAIPHVLVMGTFHSQRLTKVTVIIRRAGQCADYKTWTGEVDAIHPAFSDGTSQSGVYNSATITALDPKAIQINLKYLNIKITIRQIIGGDWLQFTAVMPPNLIPIDSEQQLCSTACTENTIFNQNNLISHRKSDTSKNENGINENTDCDTFWCRNILSAWGERGAADARSLDPENWNNFNQKSSSQVPKLLNSMLLTISLLYLTVL